MDLPYTAANRIIVSNKIMHTIACESALTQRPRTRSSYLRFAGFPAGLAIGALALGSVFPVLLAAVAGAAVVGALCWALVAVARLTQDDDKPQTA